MGGAAVALLSLLVYNGIQLWWGRTRKEAIPSKTASSRDIPSRGSLATAQMRP